MARKTLEGVRVAALVADGFEQVELTRPMKRLLRHGAEVDVISLRRGNIRGMNLLVPGRQVHVDETLERANPARYDALLLPGGFMNPDLLRQSDAALEFVRRFDRVGKPIAVICHGPWVLISAGLVRGRRLTSWQGISDDVRNAGGLWEDSPVVRDRNWVSSRGPHDIPAFEKAMLALFEERAPRSVRVERPSMVTRLLRGLAIGASVFALTRAFNALRA